MVATVHMRMKPPFPNPGSATGGGGHERLCLCGGDFIIVFPIIIQMSDEPDTVATSPPTRSAPWIGEFNVNDGDPVYFIFVEQKVLCTVNSFVKSLFVWFSLFYVFNLEYDKNTKDLCLFFQEFVFGLPGTGNSGKKSSTYTSVTTDIQSHAIN